MLLRALQHELLERQRDERERHGEADQREDAVQAAERSHVVQGILVRHGIARRLVPRLLAGRPRRVALARRAGAPEVRAAELEGAFMKRDALPSVLLAAAAAVTLSAQQPPTPPFRFERPLVTGGGGPRRIAIDVPLLVGAAPFRTATRGTDPATGRSSVALGDGLRD